VLILAGSLFGVLLSGVFFTGWWGVVFFYFLGSFLLFLYGFVWGGGFWALSFGVGFDLMSWGLVLLTL
jgi:hypothetical protein